MYSSDSVDVNAHHEILVMQHYRSNFEISQGVLKVRCSAYSCTSQLRSNNMSDNCSKLFVA